MSWDCGPPFRWRSGEIICRLGGFEEPSEDRKPIPSLWAQGRQVELPANARGKVRCGGSRELLCPQNSDRRLLQSAVDQDTWRRGERGTSISGRGRARI